jgi:MFS superfamily sulfate permease-like transporter
MSTESAAPPPTAEPGWRDRSTVLADVRASLVVFLVAIPLCLGVAVASGVPPELGLVTGIVGGIIVGFMPGSTLQVSGPAAGLTVLVFGIVDQHGIEVLGPIVLLAGLMQLGLAAVRLGPWFRAMALPVVHGMLAGIGLLIIAGQLLVIAGAEATGSGPGDLEALPGAFADAITGPGGLEHALLAGGLALAVLVAWRWAPEKIRWIPGPLVAVLVATLGTLLLGLDPERIALPSNFADAINVPDGDAFAQLVDPAILGLAVALALVASAESLLSAVAVDNMHDGKPTQYNKELAAQGTGNTIAGALGALPMTAVIVRSAANVEAGARTKASRILHGFWLLLFAAALPMVLTQIPTAVLASVLVMAGIALCKPAKAKELLGHGRRELALYVVTIVGVFFLGLLEGVLIGLAAAAVVLLLRLTRIEVHEEEGPDGHRVAVEGAATFVGVPALAGALERVPAGSDVELDLKDTSIVDPAAQELVEGWQRRHETTGATVTIRESEGAGWAAADGRGSSAVATADDPDDDATGAATATEGREPIAR